MGATEQDTPPGTVDSDRRYKVGIDSREAFRPKPRGIGLYCRHLIRELGAMGTPFDFELYHEREAPADLPYLGTSMRANRLEMKGSRYHLWERLALPMRLLSDGIELYHGTYNTLPPRLPLLRSPRLLATIHDVVVTWWDDDLDDPYVRYVRKVTPRVIRQADMIVTVSEFSRQDMIDRFAADPDKTRVIHNGIDPIYLADPPEGTAERARARFADGRPYVFAIGAALRRKNTDSLFPMLARLRDDGALRDGLLIVSGLEGRALEERRAAARRAGVEDHVRLLGYQSLEDLRDLYTGAELFVYPSLVEGWGIPILEAFACGTPVATSDSTAMPEAGGEDAVYFDPRDADSIVAAVGRALAERQAFTSRRDRVRLRARSFTWRRHAEQLAALYRELLLG